MMPSGSTEDAPVSAGDLVASLRAQLDEKQAAAEAAARLPGKDWKADSQGKGRERDGVLWDEDFANIIAWFDGYIEAARHAALNDPRQVLCEVKAARVILAAYLKAEGIEPDDWPGDPALCAGLRIAVSALADAYLPGHGPLPNA